MYMYIYICVCTYICICVCVCVCVCLPDIHICIFIHAHCNTFQHTSTQCTKVHHTSPNCHTLHHTATHYTTLQHTATHCNTLHHTASHSNTSTLRAKSCIIAGTATSSEYSSLEVGAYRMVCPGNPSKNTKSPSCQCIIYITHHYIMCYIMCICIQRRDSRNRHGG